jgi:hypothetical protein
MSPAFDLNNVKMLERLQMPRALPFLLPFTAPYFVPEELSASDL